MGARVRRSDRAVTTRDGDRAVVANLDTSELVILEGVSRHLWEAFASAPMLSEVVDEACDAVGAAGGQAGERIRSDIERFARELSRLGLLSIEQRPAGA